MKGDPYGNPSRHRRDLHVHLGPCERRRPRLAEGEWQVLADTLGPGGGGGLQEAADAKILPLQPHPAPRSEHGTEPALGRGKPPLGRLEHMGGNHGPLLEQRSRAHLHREIRRAHPPMGVPQGLDPDAERREPARPAHHQVAAFQDDVQGLRGTATDRRRTVGDQRGVEGVGDRVARRSRDQRPGHLFEHRARQLGRRRRGQLGVENTVRALVARCDLRQRLVREECAPCGGQRYARGLLLPDESRHAPPAATSSVGSTPHECVSREHP